MRSERGAYFLKLSLLFAVYFITARLGLSLDAVSGFATVVWPPTGIALASLLFLGYRYWPAITAAAFLVNLVTGASWAVALGISAGNTLEALLGAYLLNRFIKINLSLDRLKDVLGLIFLAAILSTVVSATIGTSSLFIGDVITSSTYDETWIAWWVGDVLGALVVAPFLMVWGLRLRQKVSFPQLLPIVIPFLILILTTLFVFLGLPKLGVESFPFAYLVLPPMVWITLRFDQPGSVTATFIASFIAIFGTVVGHKSDGDSLGENLLLIQSFIGVTAFTFMVMAAIVSEREQTLKKKQQLLQRTALLAKERSRLKALNRAKDDFIAIASHQLRTPASGVKQYLGMLLENYAGKLTKKQRSYIETAYSNNERQIKVINDLLRVAQIDAGKLPLQKKNCNLAQLVSSIAQQQAEEFAKRNQKLVFTTEKKRIIAPADKDLLRMVIENIIDNAGKYSSDDGEITIHASQSGKEIQLKVTDAGIGIAKKDQRRMFQKFSRVNNANSTFVDGSGLGLYWAKKIIDLHGGKITIKSELDKGSTFTLSLPAK